MFVTIIILGLTTLLAAAALFATQRIASDRAAEIRELRDELQGEETRADSNWDTVQSLRDELEAAEMFAQFLRMGRDQARAVSGQLADRVTQVVAENHMLEERYAELQADIDLVAERRAKWRARAEKAEAANAMEAGAQAAILEVLSDAMAIAEDQDQALCYAEEERRFLSVKVDRAQAALHKIYAMVSEPSRLEEFMVEGFGTSTLEGATVELVARGLRDFVALVNERSQLLEAVSAVQKDANAPMATPVSAAPSFLDDLPF